MDIIDKLRDPSYPPPPAGDMALRLSAADEIERLRTAALVRQFNEWTPPDLNPVMDQSKLSGLADGQRRPPAKVCVPNSGFDSRDGGQPPDTLQSQLADIAPYYSPLATAMARIKELEAAIEALLDCYGDHDDDFSIEARERARAALAAIG